MARVIVRDLEETDDVLDQEETNPVQFWEKKQRELLTSVIDYSLPGIADLVTTKTIDLNPSYQRRFRWDDARKSKLIESFLMNVPVPPVFLNEDDYGQFSVIDGKQRLNAITEFMRGRLTIKGLNVFQDINGKTYDDLPPKFQKVIQTRPTLRAVIVLRQSDEDIKFEVFKRLNTGGVRLNPQEIRNSTYAGNFNDLILELSVSKPFHKLLGITVPEKSVIYQEMRDAEFVLRYFTFRKNWHSFSGGIAQEMSRFMVANRNLSKGEIEGLRQDFMDTVATVGALFGESAFRRWLPEKQSWRQQVVAALYDAQMIACANVTSRRATIDQSAVIEQMKLLLQDATFRRSTDAATNTPSAFKNRIQMTIDILHRVL